MKDLHRSLPGTAFPFASFRSMHESAAAWAEEGLVVGSLTRTLVARAEEAAARLSMTERASSPHEWVRDDVAGASAAKQPEATIRRVVEGLALPMYWPEHERRTVRGVREEARRSELV